MRRHHSGIIKSSSRKAATSRAYRGALTHTQTVREITESYVAAHGKPRNVENISTGSISNVKTSKTGKAFEHSHRKRNPGHLYIKINPKNTEADKKWEEALERPESNLVLALMSLDIDEQIENGDVEEGGFDGLQANEEI